MMLDATAGNRKIWHGRNPTLPHVIFIEKETDLLIPPDIFADNTQCPFRDKIFDVILFDPPWCINLPPWFLNKKTNPSKGGVSYYGDFKTKRELFSYLNKAQKEFKRLTKRLCFKWGERNVSLWNILPFFTKSGWKMIYKKNYVSAKNRGGKSKNSTWWVTFIRLG